VPDLTHFSLFSGIGGIDLAAEWAGFRTVGQVEKADYPYRVLCKYWPDVPKWRDIRDVTRESVRRAGIGAIDLLSGGFPCQPYSVAGKRRGKEDDRHLWPEMLRVIQELRPTWVLGENVANIVNMVLDDVLADLEDAGYETQAFIIPACAVRAPHQRKRVFIVAYNNQLRRDMWRFEGQGIQRADKTCDEADSGGQDVAYSAGLERGTRAEKQGILRGMPADGEECGNAGGSGEAQSGQDVAHSSSTGLERQQWQESERAGMRLADGNQTVADTHKSGLQGHRRLQECARKRALGMYSKAFQGRRQPESRLGGVLDGISAWLDSYRWPAPYGADQYDWEPPRLAKGMPNRRERLKALGNAVVPQQVYPILVAIAAVEMAKGKSISGRFETCEAER